MDGKRSATVLLSSPIAAQRCAENAGLDSGDVAAAQSTMPSIPADPTDCKQRLHWRRRIHRSQLQSGISTSLTDATSIQFC
jgi:hypothetical protein